MVAWSDNRCYHKNTQWIRQKTDALQNMEAIAVRLKTNSYINLQTAQRNFYLDKTGIGMW